MSWTRRGRSIRRCTTTTPREEQEVTIEQLSSLDAVYRKNGLYADFAIWVPFWHRMIKMKRFMGQVLDEHGVL